MEKNNIEAPNIIPIGTVKRPRSDSLTSNSTYMSELEDEAIHITASKLGPNVCDLTVAEINQSASDDTVDNITGILVKQKPGTHLICPSCSQLRSHLDNSRNRALLRQAGSNAIRLVKEAMFFATPPEIQKTFMVSNFSKNVDWRRVELHSLDELYSLIAADQREGFLESVSLQDYAEVRKLCTAAAKLKGLFHADDHPTTHFDGEEATYESCCDALATVCSESEQEQRVLSWLENHHPGDSYLFYQNSVL